MAHALLPDFSRLTLSTGARDSVREEIVTELLAAPNAYIERAIAQVQSRNLETLRGAPDAAQQYKSAMDALRNRDFALQMTAAWQASAKRYAAFLQKALEALEDLSSDLQADMLDEETDAIDAQAYLDRRAVLETILTVDANTTWEVYGAKVPLGRDGYDAHKVRLGRAMEDMQSAIDILNTRPDTTQEDRELWRNDLFEVMRLAAQTRTTGEVDVVRALADRRREREGGGGGGAGGSSDAYRAHYDMAIPELTPYMQLIFDLIMKEIYDIKEMILRNSMGPGQYVEETVDFGEFGLGRATIKVYTTPPRQKYYIFWYRTSSTARMPIQRSIRNNVKANQESYAVQSQPDLKRWLDWLDQNELDARARRQATRTWTRNPPITPRVVGAANA